MSPIDMLIRLFVLLSILVCQGSILAQPVWHLKAEIAKATYLVGEQVDVGISVTNLTSKTIRVDRYRSTSGILTNEMGEKLPYNVSVHGIFAPRETSFVSGQEDYRVTDLTFPFGRRITTFSDVREIPEGSYRLDLSLCSPNARPESASVSFRVIGPAGEEAMVYSRLKAILRASEQAGPSAAAPFASELRNLAETHPASVYAPIILSHAQAYYQILLKDQTTARELQRRIVELYPGSSKAQGHITGLLLETPSREERIAILRNILDKVPQNLPMRKEIERQIREAEDS